MNPEDGAYCSAAFIILSSTPEMQEALVKNGYTVRENINAIMFVDPDTYQMAIVILSNEEVMGLATARETPIAGDESTLWDIVQRSDGDQIDLVGFCIYLSDNVMQCGLLTKDGAIHQAKTLVEGLMAYIELEQSEDEDETPLLVSWEILNGCIYADPNNTEAVVGGIETVEYSRDSTTTTVSKTSVN